MKGEYTEMLLEYPEYIKKLFDVIAPYTYEYGGLRSDAPEHIKAKLREIEKWEDEQRIFDDEIEIISDPASYFKKRF